MSQNPSMSDVSRNARRPDDEDLAALAEGRLDASMRGAVLERLASDEDYYELYTELLRFRDEEVQDGEATDAPDAEVLPFEGRASAPPERAEEAVVSKPPSWRRWRRPLVGLAAAAVLAAVIAPRLLLRPPSLDRLVVGLEPQSSDLTVRPGRTERGEGAEVLPLRLDERLSFRLGAFLLDAAIAREARDARQDVTSLLSDHVYLDEYWRPCAEAGPVAPCAAKLLDSDFVDLFALRLGLWSRAVWLAGRAGDEKYLSSRKISGGLRALGRAALDDGAKSDIRALRQRLDKRDYPALLDEIERIARDYRSAFHTLPEPELGDGDGTASSPDSEPSRRDKIK